MRVVIFCVIDVSVVRTDASVIIACIVDFDKHMLIADIRYRRFHLRRLLLRVPCASFVLFLLLFLFVVVLLLLSFARTLFCVRLLSCLNSPW